MSYSILISLGELDIEDLTHENTHVAGLRALDLTDIQVFRNAGISGKYDSTIDNFIWWNQMSPFI